MGAESKRCTSCGAWIVFARHDKTGKMAPLERDPDGRWTIVHPSYFEAAPNVPAAHRWSNHLIRCPAAAAEAIA